ncbi:hypothetical protein, partial [Aquidulcibacter sp.]|uniref:hypothetical protein n=1 Tax=Aquidulcibacter sp. TaxID=2052990 RepID=UPI0025B90891
MTMIDAVLQPSRAQPSMPPRDSQPVSADLDHMQVAATLITTDVSTSLASDLITTKRPSSLMREFPDNSTLLLKEQVIAARLSIALIVSAVALAGCSTIDNTRLAPIAVPLATPKVSGKPTSTIEPVRQFTRQQLDEMATKAGIAPIAGSAACDVAVYRLQYDTQGGRGEPVTSSAAVLVPQGTAEACTGRRPLVGYARGTAFVQDTDMAKPEHGEADAVAAATIFAAQG